jgi:hypothetical protein
LLGNWATILSTAHDAERACGMAPKHLAYFGYQSASSSYRKWLNNYQKQLTVPWRILSSEMFVNKIYDNVQKI